MLTHFLSVSPRRLAVKRIIGIVPVLCVLAAGCARSPNEPVSSQGESLPAKETSPAYGNSIRADIIASQPVPSPETDPAEAGNRYPEKNEVLAILYRARELRQKAQFQAALELVSQALVVDPYSPAAQTMERELAEILKRLRTPENRERSGSASRAA
jgi:hypothetical protein